MRIIFENQDKSIGILIPTQQALDTYGIDAIAKKDVPAGLPYWIVEDSEIPTNREDRDSWVMDTDIEPHGYGSVFYTFEEVSNDKSR